MFNNLHEVLSAKWRLALPDEYNIMLNSTVEAVFYLASNGFTQVRLEDTGEFIRLFKDKTFHFTSIMRFDKLGLFLNGRLYVMADRNDSGYEKVELTLKSL